MVRGFVRDLLNWTRDTLSPLSHPFACLPSDTFYRIFAYLISHTRLPLSLLFCVEKSLFRKWNFTTMPWRTWTPSSTTPHPRSLCTIWTFFALRYIIIIQPRQSTDCGDNFMCKQRRVQVRWYARNLRNCESIFNIHAMRCGARCIVWYMCG